MRKTRCTVISTLLCIFVTMNAFGESKSDIAKEKRWAEQVIDTLFDGEAIWLTADGHRFLGLEMSAEDESKELAIIIVHGIGIHPNWEQIIQPVRVGLAEIGMHTLSIQMPVLPNETESKQYAPLFQEVPSRFDAAIQHIKQQGFTDIIIVGHSLGAAMTSYYLSGEADPSVKAAILIGLSAGNSNAPVDTANLLTKIDLPLLDLYGHGDLDDVTSSAGLRQTAADTGGNTAYKQIVIEGANHFFDNKDEELIRIVVDWIEDQ